MKCSFCGKDLEPGFGKMSVTKDSKALYFCSRKCEKNMMKLGRNPRYVKWTNLYQSEKKKGK